MYVLKENLKDWESLCCGNHIITDLCKIYLLDSKLDLYLLNLEEAESKLTQADLLASEMELELYKNVIQDEIIKLKNYKTNVVNFNTIEELKYREEQERDFIGYLKDLSNILAQKEQV